MISFFENMSYNTIVGIVAGILTSVAMLPQVIKAIRTGETKDISLFMVILLTTGLGIWVYYGILRDDKPIIYTNSFSLLVNLTLLILRIKHKQDGDEPTGETDSQKH